jgi:hypothetical protein
MPKITPPMAVAASDKPKIYDIRMSLKPYSFEMGIRRKVNRIRS